MNTPNHLYPPLFSFDWQSACSPHARAVEKQVIEWADDHRLRNDRELRAPPGARPSIQGFDYGSSAQEVAATRQYVDDLKASCHLET